MINPVIFVQNLLYSVLSTSIKKNQSQTEFVQYIATIEFEASESAHISYGVVIIVKLRFGSAVNKSRNFIICDCRWSTPKPKLQCILKVFKKW